MKILIYTSYFAQLRNFPQNIIPISICGKAPNWYNGLQYKKLAPKYGFFMEWKKNHDNNFYIKHFNDEVLTTLSAAKVLEDLQELIPDELKKKIITPIYKNESWHIALICYEKSEDFCHRYLVSKWLCDNGYKCDEWKKVGIDG